MTKDAKLKQNTFGLLTIVGTPIGNSMDLSPRGIEAFENSDIILCEDTRIAKKLSNIRNFKIKNLISFNNYNENNKLDYILKKIMSGKNVVLSCDSGMPLISDPGFKLVKECIINKIEVDVVPGPSAIISALVVSGLASNNFYYAGFPSKKKNARIDNLKSLINLDATIIWFESPKRVLSYLKELLLVFGNREAVVARELTKLYQEIIRNNLKSLISEFEERPTLKGEYVILIEGRKKLDTKVLSDDIYKKIEDLIKTNTLKAAVEKVFIESGLPKKIIYNAALKIKDSN